MKAIKIESCKHCLSICNDYPICAYEMWADYENRTYKGFHPNCKLENYQDIEAIRELCKEPHDSYRELQAEILAILNQ